MRIVAGKHRGRKLERPPSTITRPTMDRVRQSIFNMLTHGDWHGVTNVVEGATVLDAFGGSGSLGLEAISQGAKFTTFFDKNPKALSVIRHNVEAFKEQDNCKILRADATNPPKVSEPVDLVLLDPPFGHDLTTFCLPPLLKTGWIGKDTIVVAEIEADKTFTMPKELEILRHKVYGTTQVFFMGHGSHST